MQAKITKTTVDELAAGKRGDALRDTEIRGFSAELLPSGQISFCVRYYNEAGRRRNARLGLYGKISPDQARALAKQKTGAAAAGRDPVEEKKQKRKRDGKTVNAVLDLFQVGHSDKLKTGKQVKRAFTVYVRPQIGNLIIYDVKRGQVGDMLDKIATDNGEVQADRVLAYVRKAFNWFAVKDEDFRTPIVKGMARTNPKKRARKRILDADEIRDLFQALDELHAENGAPLCFRPFVHMLFYSATRLRMPSNMTREEIKGRDWIIAGERNKGGLEHMVPLTDTMRELIKNNNAPFVFSNDGGETPFKGFSKAKVALDKKIAELRKADGRKPMPHWTFHDLRRTARSIMGQNGVQPDHAERVLGHVITGVRAVYDPNLVHAYRKEKLAALLVLERQINRILRPGSKVVAFPKRA